MRFSSESISQKLAILQEEAEERDTLRRAKKEGLPYLELKKKPVDPSVLELIPQERAREGRIAVIARKGKRLTVALYALGFPKTKELIRSLEERGFKPETFITSLSGLSQAWSYYPAFHRPVESVVAETKLEETALREMEKQLKIATDLSEVFNLAAKDASTTEVLKTILASALVLGVSDIHLEPVSRIKTLLRFRIDGILREVTSFTDRLAASIVNRLKLLSELKLNVTDAPQDGRFTIESDLGPVEARVSVVPAEFGEAVALRVLNPQVISMKLSDLGLRDDDEEIIVKELKRPNGLILVTGPTGSGKTTTIYAFLKKIRTPAQKIITIEDPIEYHLEGIEQTQADPKSGYNFAVGLSSILRQDPDIILVGEVRDLETAETAIHAALTGHLVFSTLHTNNAAGAIPRLIDLGVKPSVIGPALILVIAERLVRRLCLTCRKETVPDKSLEEKIRKFLSRLPKRVSPLKMAIRLYEAVGCKECNEGFRGQIGIFEILEMGKELDALIKQEAVEAEIDEVAKKQGMVSMQDDAIIKALSGITTLLEVERVTGPIEW